MGKLAGEKLAGGSLQGEACGGKLAGKHAGNRGVTGYLKLGAKEPRSNAARTRGYLYNLVLNFSCKNMIFYRIS